MNLCLLRKSAHRQWKNCQMFFFSFKTNRRLEKQRIGYKLANRFLTDGYVFTSEAPCSPWRIPIEPQKQNRQWSWKVNKWINTLNRTSSTVCSKQTIKLQAICKCVEIHFFTPNSKTELCLFAAWAFKLFCISRHLRRAEIFSLFTPERRARVLENVTNSTAEKEERRRFHTNSENLFFAARRCGVV